MKSKHILVAALICGLTFSSIAYSTGGSKQPTRPAETQKSVSWYQPVLDFFYF